MAASLRPSCVPARRRVGGARVCGARRPGAAPLPARQLRVAAAAAAEEPKPARGPLKQLKRWLTNMYIGSVSDDAGIMRLAEKFPDKTRATFEGLYTRYKAECIKGMGEEEGSAATVDVFKKMIRTYSEQMEDPYQFPSYHEGIREPFDYYALGNQYTGQLVDYSRSCILNAERLDQIQEWLANGENVILLANHQSEADAAFIPLMTQKSHPGLGEQVIYVAGDRVVTDIMAKPFSMGRNLLCVFSKKHINEVPELRSAKMKQNIRTLKEMERLFKEGGKLLWIAPSGGRDRRQPDGTLTPDTFDPAAVEMVRKIGTKKGMPKAHYVPFSMHTYDIMPPPDKVESALGEVRVVNYCGAGLGFGADVDVTEAGPWAAGLSEEELADKETSQKALADYVRAQVAADHEVLLKTNRSEPFALEPGCSQPWAPARESAMVN